MSDQKKIMVILPSNVGGAERVTVTIAGYLEAAGFHVMFVVLADKVGSIKAILPENHPPVLVKIRNIWDFSVTRLANLMRKERPDYVFCSLRYLNPRVLLAAKLVGKIKVVVRNDNWLLTARWDTKILMRLTYRWAHAVIAQQEEMRQELIDVMRLPAEKVIAINNPLDTDRIDILKDEPSPYPSATGRKYLCVGRFFHNKGQDLACEAFHQIHLQDPEAQLYLLGKYKEDDPYYLKVCQIIHEHHMEGHVHIIGHETNPFKWMKHCDCFILPSRYEGTPNSLIEAMYVGRPVVATRCIPMIERMVQDGYNGILVESGNTKEMAEGMKKACHLHDFKMTYHPGTAEDFTQLFT